MSKTRDARRRRAIRWVFFLAMFAALYFGIARRFSVMRLDVETADAMRPALSRGGWNLVDRHPAHLLERGWIVWWEWQDGSLFSRVLARPGDRLVFGDTRWSLVMPGERRRMLPPEVDLDRGWDGRELGLGEYFLLNDRLEAGWPDSRRVGAVARSAIRARVMFSFGGDG